MNLARKPALYFLNPGFGVLLVPTIKPEIIVIFKADGNLGNQEMAITI